MLGTKRSLLIFLHDTGMAALSFLISLTLRLGQDILIWPREVVGFGLVAFTSVAAVVIATSAHTKCPTPSPTAPPT